MSFPQGHRKKKNYWVWVHVHACACTYVCKCACVCKCVHVCYTSHLPHVRMWCHVPVCGGACARPISNVCAHAMQCWTRARAGGLTLLWGLQSSVVCLNGRSDRGLSLPDRRMARSGLLSWPRQQTKLAVLATHTRPVNERLAQAVKSHSKVLSSRPTDTHQQCRNLVIVKLGRSVSCFV